MDHTLINILRRGVVATCTAKVDWVRRNMVLRSSFHPDYITTDVRREPVLPESAERIECSRPAPTPP
jgi:hypothetical protein